VALGGILADLCYLYAVSALPEIDSCPTFIGWVGGEETADERDQLRALDAPGLAVGSRLDGFDAWSSVEPEDHRDSIEFVRSAFHEIRQLSGSKDEPGAVDASAGPSTVSCTVRAGTGQHGMGRAGYGGSRNPTSRARSGTGWDRTRRRPEGS